MMVTFHTYNRYIYIYNFVTLLFACDPFKRYGPVYGDEKELGHELGNDKGLGKFLQRRFQQCCHDIHFLSQYVFRVDFVAM